VALVWDVRFQDALVANSDTNARRLKGLLMMAWQISAGDGEKVQARNKSKPAGF
jgi:hypothetical protein